MGGCNAGCGACCACDAESCGKPGDGLYFSDAGSQYPIDGPVALRMSLAGCCGSGGKQLIWGQGQAGDLNRTYSVLKHRGFGADFDITVSYDDRLVNKTPTVMGPGWTLSPASRFGGGVVDEGNGSTAVYNGLTPAAGVFRNLASLGGGAYLETQFDNSYYVYNAPLNGRLARIMDFVGNHHYFNYDVGTGKLSSIEFASGRVATFGYEDGLLDRIECPGNRVTYFRYAPTGGGMLRSLETINRLVEIVGPDLCHSYFDYDENGYLAKAVDPAGHTAYYVHDGDGRVTNFELDGAETTIEYDTPSAGKTTVTDGEDQDWVVEYSPAGAITKEIDPQSNDHQNSFDGQYEKLSSEDRTGATTLLGYDGDGNVIRRYDPRTFTTYYAYDGHHHKTRQLNPDGCFAYWFYDAFGNLEKSTNFRGYSTSMTYDRAELETVTDALGGETTYDHDSFGMVEAMTDPNENTTEYEYDDAGNQTKIIDALEGVTYFAYDKDDHKINDVNARGYPEYFYYDCRGSLSESIDREEHVTEYTYDAWGRRSSTTSPNGLVNSAQYDAEGRQTVDSNNLGDGRVYTSYYFYDTVGFLVEQADPRENHSFYGRDGEGRILQQLDAMLNSTYFAYDGNGNKIREVGPRWPELTLAGATTYYFYDSMNRLNRTLDPLLRETTYDYDCNGNQIEIVAPGPEQTEKTYDELDRLSTETSPTGSLTRHDYDPNGNEILTTNPRTFPTYYHYDELNRRDSIQDALGGVQYFVFDEVGNTVKQRNAREYWAYFEYDRMNREVERIDERDSIWAKVYDAMGNVVQDIPPVGGINYSTYDRLSRLTSITDGEGDTTYFYYDPNGNRTKVRSPRGYESFMHYDALNRMDRSVSAVSSETYFYFDEAGNTTEIKNPLLNTTYFYFDSLNRSKAIKDPLGNFIYFEYDAAGNQSAVINQFVSPTQFFYDASNRLIESIDTLNNTAYWGYDANSNLIRSVDNNGTLIYFDYDELDRRTGIRYRPVGGPNTDQSFDYDAVGNLIEMNDGWGESTFDYDPGNLMTQHVTPNDDEVNFGYDAAGNRIRLQYPEFSASAPTCYYGYDDAQRMEKLLSPNGQACYYQYDQSSNVVYKKTGTVMQMFQSFDEAERVTSIRYTKPNGDSIAYYDYGWDAGNRITHIERVINNLGTVDGYVINYGYDANDRLTSEIWTDRSGMSQIKGFFYSYDECGNRLTQRVESDPLTEEESAYFTYALDCSLRRRDAYSPTGGAVSTYYSYDLNGALISMLDVQEGQDDKETTFLYGPNQLLSAVIPPVGDGEPAYFEYDGQLNRYFINNGGLQRYLLWDGLNCLEERDNAGNLIVRYTYGYSPVYGIGNCVEVKFTSGETYTLVMDHRGSVNEILDESGDQVGYRHYNAFGEIFMSGGDWPVNFGYQSNWFTLQIGQKFWGLSAARLYDPATGRFTQRDSAPQENIMMLFLNISGEYNFHFRSYPPNLYIYSSINLDPTGLLEECKKRYNHQGLSSKHMPWAKSAEIKGDKFVFAKEDEEKYKSALAKDAEAECKNYCSKEASCKDSKEVCGSDGYDNLVPTGGTG